jgi:D-glycero-beta-D-manno-heptose 1-phosphate adenylyltransferase
MPQTQHIFGSGSNVEGRVVKDYSQLGDRVDALKKLGLKIGLTSGTFDLYHEGHSRYLEKAKQECDFLIVGIDDDEKVKVRKGQNRPIVSESERAEVLCHCRHVDLVFLKQLSDEKWKLIKTVKPDVLVATQTTYKPEQIEALKEHCKDVLVLPPQAATSTTARIRLLLMTPVGEIKAKLQDVMIFLDSFGER